MTASIMTQDQMLAQIADLQAKNAALAAAIAARPLAKITCRVTAKKADGTGTDGALSVYGLGRFPITLYRTQWERLLAKDTVASITAFIATNASLLATKPSA